MLRARIPEPAPPFRFSWLLVDELAIGSAPLHSACLDRLSEEGVTAVLSLCAEAEAPLPATFSQRFRAARVVLPDHRGGRWPEPRELEAAVAALAALRPHGPVFLHCVAAVERSPLVAMAWLMATRQLSLESALAYVQLQHPGTAPFQQQLEALRLWQLRCLDPASPLPSRAAA